MALNLEIRKFGKSKPVKNPLERPSVSLIVGPTFSGKSTVLGSLLAGLEKVEFDQAFFFSGNGGRDPMLKSLSPDVEISGDPERFQEVIQKIKSDPSKDKKTLLVLDDLQGNKAFNAISNRDSFVDFVISHRHYGGGVWIMLTGHTFRGLNPIIRKQASQMFLFPPRAKTEIRTMHEELPFMPDKLNKAFSIVSQRPFGFLYLNLRSHEMFDGFNDRIDF